MVWNSTVIDSLNQDEQISCQPSITVTVTASNKASYTCCSCVFQFVRLERYLSGVRSSNSSQRVRHEDTRRRCGVPRDVFHVCHVSWPPGAGRPVRYGRRESGLWDGLHQRCVEQSSTSATNHFTSETAARQSAQYPHQLKYTVSQKKFTPVNCL